MEKPSPQSKVAIPGSKRGIKGFFAETGRELRKVNWPTTQETFRLTWVVLIVCAAVTGTLLLLSAFFSVLVNIITTGRPG